MTWLSRAKSSISTNTIALGAWIVPADSLARNLLGRIFKIPYLHSVGEWKFWYVGDDLHRVNGPAVIGKDGNEEWYQFDKRHRVDGPAVILPSGTQEWHWKGQRHRADGPAYIAFDGTKKWYLHDKLHRLGGPAVEQHGMQIWYEHGKIHRLDGPAVMNTDGRVEWHIDGIEHSLHDWLYLVDMDEDEKLMLKLKYG